MVFRKFLVLLLISLFAALHSVVAAHEHITSQQSLPSFPIAFMRALDSQAPVQFQTTGIGGTILFTSTSVELNLPSETGSGAPIPLKLLFENADPSAIISGSKPLPGKVNYFTGNNSSAWHSNISTFGTITYNNLYPGIDLVYNGTEGQLKSTYYVAPGVNPKQIMWRYDGSQSIFVDGTTGDLQIVLDSQRSIIEYAPIAWQEINGRQIFVSVRYQIQEDNAITFEVGDYDLNHPLIIDPILVYSSFLSTTDSTGTSIRLDAAGNIYIAGYVFAPSSYFPIVDAFQSEHGNAGCQTGNNCYDVFVTKLNPTGDRILYSTFIGGSGYDDATGMSLDSDGSIYIAGNTSSKDFPTQNAIYTTLGRGCTSSCATDAFMLKLNPAGNALIYSTYLGGSGTENLESMIVNSEGSMYVGGYTNSTNFPTVNALNTTSQGGTDVFLSKLNPTGTVLEFSTYIGGSGVDRYVDIALDSTNNIYVSGGTNSTNFPVTPATAYQSVIGASQFPNDAFLIKLNPSASSILYSTYLGGNGSDSGRGLVVDDTGVYLVGMADSGFPTTYGAFDTTYEYNSGMDSFVAKFNTNAAGAASLIYSTYVGGTGYDEPLGVTTPGDGTLYVVGRTEATSFPLVNPIQSSPGKTSSESDGFIFRLNPNGSALLFASFLGGQQSTCDQFERAVGVTSDVFGNAYVTGYSRSSCFPTTPNAYLSAGGGVFVSKIAPYTLDIEQTVSNPTPDEGQTIALTLKLTNTSAATLNNIFVQDTLPTSLQFVSANSPNYNAGTGRWTISSLSPGQTVSVIIQAKIKTGVSGTHFVNTAAVTQFTPANIYVGLDSSTVTISVGLDLAVQNIADKSFASPGDTITYTVTATNKNTSTEATGVVVNDLLPSDVTHTVDVPSQGTYNVGSGEWLVGNLGAGTSATLSITATINAVPNRTTITNTASISGNQLDFVTSNNSQSNSISVSICEPLNHIARLSVSYDGSDETVSPYTLNPSVSSDGRLVAFESFASNLVSGDTNNLQDVFVYDRATCQTQLVSISQDGYHANGYSTHAQISADGRYVAFRSSGSTLVTGDTNGFADIFVRDLLTGSMIRASVASNGTQANGDSDYPAISADGRYITYQSKATNLVSGDTNGFEDAFVYDRQTGITTRISIGLNNSQSNNMSQDVFISADGHYIGFTSWATNLVSNDSNGQSDIFIYDQVTHTIILASMNSNGFQANYHSYLATLSADGHYIAFASNGRNFDNANPGTSDVYVRNLQTGITTRLSTASNGTIANGSSNSPQISMDGRYVVFQSQASNLVSGDSGSGYDIFIKDRITGQIAMLSTNASGTPANSTSIYPFISPDGHYAVFTSGASNLVTYEPGFGPMPQDSFLVESPFPVTPVNTTDLVVSQTASPTVLISGEEIKFTVTVTNSSEHDATGVTLRDLLPASLTYSQIQPVPYTCNQIGSAVYCTIGTIPAGESVSVELRLNIQPESTGLITHEITVLADEVDSNSWTNVSQKTVQINAPPSNLSPTALAYNHIQLDWTDNSHQESKFWVERSSNGINDWVEIGQTDSNVRRYNDPSLICETTYYYRVRAAFSDGRTTAYSSTVSAATLTCPPLHPPYALEANTIAFNQINITWTDDSVDETDFSVERSNDGVNNWLAIGSSAAATTTGNYEDINTICETTYYYRLRTHRSSNNAYSDYSDVIHATTSECPPLDAPTALLAEPAEVHVQLTWVDNSIDETDFKVERSPDGISDWVEIAQTNANVNQYDDIELDCSTTYFYRVRAHRSSNDAYSEYSATTEVMTLTCPPLNIPEDIEVIPSAPDQVELTWVDTSIAESGYKIERSLYGDGAQGWNEIGQTRANVTYFSDTQVICSEDYYYRVRAYRKNGDYSDYASADAITLICPPAALEANSISFLKVDLTWHDESSNEDGFSVERLADGSDNWVVIGQTPSNIAYFADTQTLCDTTYSYRVRAYNTADSTYSAYSNTTTYTTPTCSNVLAAPALNFQADDSAMISWNSISWALEYEIEISDSEQFDGDFHQYIRVANTELSVEIPSLPRGVYHWRVRARINDTQWSRWSLPEHFTTIGS